MCNLILGSDVVFLCAACTYFELKKQLKSQSKMSKHTKSSLFPCCLAICVMQV